MKRIVIGTVTFMSLLAIAFAALANGGPIASAATADEGPASWEPCDARAGGETVPAECTTLSVPENRQDPGSRQISIPVIRIKATGADPAEAIFRFEGGPGKTNQEFDTPAGFLERHDVVQVGYRGVDGSVVLDCPEYKKALKGRGGDLFSEESQAEMHAAMGECASSLQDKGVDLDGYTILEVTDDIEAVRLALGYDRISLLSESYGTRVAQIYAQRFPDNVVRSAMIGVNPPGRFIWDPEMIDYQIGLYSDLCAKDPECSERTSDLADTIRQVNADMPGRWLVYPIDPGKVKVVAFAQLFHAETAPMAIDAYLSAAEGDASGLAFMSFAYNLQVPKLAVWGDMIAKAYSADFDPDLDYGQLGAPDSIMGSPIAQLLWPFTASWTQTQMPEEYRTAQPSDVDTLIINGNLDFSTPAENATAELLPLLSNGHEVILTDMGHTDDFWTAQPAAAEQLLLTYFDSGDVDASGFQHQPVSFAAPFPSFTVLGKAMVVLPLLIFGLLGLVIWRIVVRRGRKRLVRTEAPPEVPESLEAV
ncbi:MAG: alpha/beta hydrolase [Hyphomicrobiales bacterium]|nr:alpha/beta hydrolase [Hyphomicrobiales bacterium]